MPSFIIIAGSLSSILLTLVDSVEDILDRIVVRRDVATVKFFSVQLVHLCRVILQTDENASFHVMLLSLLSFRSS
jgi:hypothetical protein